MLSNAASIATLVLFAIYFIGRFITIFRMQELEPIDLILTDTKFDRMKYQIVDEFLYDIPPEGEVWPILVLRSISGIRSLVLYEYQYDNELNVIDKKVVSRRSKLVNIGQSIVFYTGLPELVPMYEIEYETMDYRKVVFPVVDNMKSGVLTEFMVPKHTVKSVLYYFFR